MPKLLNFVYCCPPPFFFFFAERKMTVQLITLKKPLILLKNANLRSRHSHGTKPKRDGKCSLFNLWAQQSKSHPFRWRSHSFLDMYYKLLWRNDPLRSPGQSTTHKLILFFSTKDSTHTGYHIYILCTPFDWTAVFRSANPTAHVARGGDWPNR